MPQKGQRSSTVAAGAFPILLIGLGVALLAVLTALSGASLVRSGSNTWHHTSADDCPAGSPAKGCVAELPGTTTGRVTTRDGGSSLKAVVYVDVPDAPEGTDLFNDAVVVKLSNSDADRLHLTGAGQHVLVELFDGEAIGITGSNDETTTVADPPIGHVIRMFAATFVLLGALVLAGSLLLARVRRSRSASARSETLPVRPPRFAGPLACGLVVGGIAGALAGWAVTTLGSESNLLPSMFGVAVLAGLATAATTYRVGNGVPKPAAATAAAEPSAPNRRSGPLHARDLTGQVEASAPSDSRSAAPIRARLRRGDED